jgi:hypothetical protein
MTAATVIAGLWSMMSGTFFLVTLRAAGLLASSVTRLG